MEKLSHRLQKALTLLEKHQGEKVWQGSSNPLDCLMLTLLSQNTNDRLRDRAYQQLRDRFPSWEQVAAAPAEQIEAAIRVAGLSAQKSRRMKHILHWVHEQFGELSLHSLNDMTNQAALQLLQSQKGIGVKTAAVVLMASLGRDLCPVDTHVHRIAQRLAWVPDGVSAERTFVALRPHIPKGKGHSLHLNLLQFGRTICAARKPLCANCFLWEECFWEGKEQR
ncbi:MAG: endonuclease III [bacterium]